MGRGIPIVYKQYTGGYRVWVGVHISKESTTAQLKYTNKSLLDNLASEAAVPISSRRLNYLQTILRRPKEELIQRVYDAQKSDPTPGDFYQFVKDDIGGEITEEYIQ